LVVLEQLSELQKNLEIIEENNKIIRSGSNIYILNKAKRDYENFKALYEKKIIHKETLKEEDIDKLQVELYYKKETFHSVKRVMKEKIQRANEEIEKAQAEVARLKKEIPEKYLIIFFGILETQTSPISTIKNSRCSACKHKIEDNEIYNINNNDEIVFCPSCGRILSHSHKKDDKKCIAK